MPDIRDSDEWKRAVERAAGGPELTPDQRRIIGRAFGTVGADEHPDGADQSDGGAGADTDDQPDGDDDKRPADPA